MNEIKEILLEAPDSQLDAAMVRLVRQWSDIPRPLEVLEVLDKSIHGALASDVVIRLLQLLYAKQCSLEGVTHESLVPLATWRK